MKLRLIWSLSTGERTALIAAPEAGGDDSEPTGRSVSFQGASIIRVEGDKIRSDCAYYDRKGLDEQLAPN